MVQAICKLLRDTAHRKMLVAQEADDRTIVEFYETTRVRFADVQMHEIEAYIATGEPWGKAGAYGIQGAAGAWVQGMQGCYFNVMGFPLHRFACEVAGLIERRQLRL
jgi:septum formation protein